MSLPKRTPWQIQKAVVMALFLRELKTRFGAHRLGAIWLFLEPITHISLILAIFRYFRGGHLPGVDFTLFLLVGVVPFLLFKSITLRIMEGVEGNKGLFTYRQIKPMDVFLARALLEMSLYCVVFCSILLGMLWLGFDIAVVAPIAFIAVCFLLALGGFGLGLVFSAIVELMPEAKPLLRMLFMPLYLLSGILFPVAALSNQNRAWLQWNPVMHAIELARAAFMEGYRAIPEASPRFVLEITLVLTFVGLALYRRYRLAMVAQ